MSGISNLRARMSDVPGIETLEMSLASGVALLKWGNGYSATAPAAASDAEIEAAVRNAIKLPPVSILDQVAPAPTPVPAAVRPAAASTAAASPATAHMTVKEMMADHMATMAKIHEAQMALLKSSLDRQATAVSNAVTSVVGKIDGQTDDFLSMMGQFANDLG